MTVVHSVVIFKIVSCGLGWTFPNLTETTNCLNYHNFFCCTSAYLTETTVYPNHDSHLLTSLATVASGVTP